jgi:outer membrane protein insertion porin family
MLRRYFSMLLLSLLLANRTADAAETVHVLVLPFEIHASQNLAYLTEDIPKVIQSHLQTEGAVSVEMDRAQATAALNVTSEVSALKQLGLKAGADSVIWGSMTRLGNNISLDINMVETVGTKPVFSIYESGTSMENLRAIVNQAAEKLARQLFRRELITGVRVTGNNRIEADAIERVIRVKKGDVLRAGELSTDMKNIYKMGYFEDIRVEAEDSEGGKLVVFHVKEKPTIRRISFSGNHVFKDAKLRENLTISTGSILNIFTVKSNIEQLQVLYKEKNYHNTKISYNVQNQENNQADIEFVVEEGKKIKIKSITFQGNRTFPDKKLKKLIGTSEKGIFSWLTSSGELNREDIALDAARLMAYYHTQGFIHAKVADPVIDFEDQWIQITFRIEEGERFKVGTIDVDGELILPKARLMPELQIAKESFFNQEAVRTDILRLTDLYADAGFAYADISPMTKEDPENLLVDITYTIKKGDRVYFENIVINGNTRTRDKVIRRELRIFEQSLYSGNRLKASVRNLNRLDFFEDVKVDTPKGSAEDKMDVNIEVVEKSTGTFTFGAGYSTTDNFFVTGSVAQRNLFGRGQILKLSGQVGGISDIYNLSLTEPWLFDIPVSATLDLFRTQREYDTYYKSSLGGGVVFSYPVWDFTRASIAYRYSVTDISDVAESASDNIKELEGENTTSAITTALRYDSRDRTFNTTHGQKHTLTYTYAGLGGNVGFNKIVGALGFYIPVYKKLVSVWRGEAGIVEPIPDKILPDYEKFYLGGINSLRGFAYQGIFIPTINDKGQVSQEGGNKFVNFNFELTYPLFKDLGIVGVIFYDTGNVYGQDESIDFSTLRQAAGYGIRWLSPLGPIRIEGGHILDPNEANGEDSGVKWEFAMGGAF